MTAPLSIKRKADRIVMVAQLVALVEARGFAAVLDDPTGSRRDFYVNIEAGDARVGINFDASALPGFVTPWNIIAGRQMRFTDTFGVAIGAQVNKSHRCKCMGFASDFAALLVQIGRALDCIASGAAFYPAPDLFHALKAQEPAKRAIEIALVGDHSIGFLPHEGSGYQFTAYDINQLQGEHRAIAQAHFDRFKREPMGLDAARDQIDQVRAACGWLADATGTAFNPVLSGTLDVNVAPLSFADLMLPPPCEAGAKVAARVTAARARRAGIEGLSHDADALMALWRRNVVVSDDDAAAVVEVARSIAALGTAGNIGRMDLAEAISYAPRQQVPA